jgi:enoyl-CoA hydratase/carnithine racemase
MATVSRENGIDVLTLSNPPANALDFEFMEAILRCLDEAEASDARALIVTGEKKVFSAGADLFRVLDAGADYIERAGATMSSVFERLFRFPKPTVAAVNGHAIAGGSVITCACDYRIASAGDARIGFSELAVGVPFPAWALEILRFAVGNQHLRDLTFMARTMSADEARSMGILDEVVAPDELMDKATKAAQRLARIPAETYQLTKEALIGPAVERAERLGPEHDREVAFLWSSEPVHAAIREFLDRTIGKSSR